MWPRNMDKLSLIIDSLHLLLQQGEASCKFFARYFFSSEYLFSSPDVYSNLKYKSPFSTLLLEFLPRSAIPRQLLPAIHEKGHEIPSILLVRVPFPYQLTGSHQIS